MCILDAQSGLNTLQSVYLPRSITLLQDVLAVRVFAGFREVSHGAGVYSMSTDITLDAQQAVLPEDGGAVMTGR